MILGLKTKQIIFCFLVCISLCVLFVQYKSPNKWIPSSLSSNKGKLQCDEYANVKGMKKSPFAYRKELNEQQDVQLDFTSNDIGSGTYSLANRTLRDVEYQINQKQTRGDHLSTRQQQSKRCREHTQVANQKKSKIYIITPTYRRPEQIPELTRLSQTLMHVENIYWLVVEDAVEKTIKVTEILNKSGIPFEHLTAPMPPRYKYRNGAKPKGVSNRNKGIEWIRTNANDGVLYFADDDNTYALELFEEMRNTKKVSVWPVGLCTRYGVSTPIVKNGKLIGFYDGWIAGRKFPLDMAGFAVNVRFLHARPKARMPYAPGYEEDGFLKSMTPFEPSEIELKADNCSKIMVWHTQTRSNALALAVDKQMFNGTNLIKISEQLV